MGRLQQPRQQKCLIKSSLVALLSSPAPAQLPEMQGNPSHMHITKLRQKIMKLEPRIVFIGVRALGTVGLRMPYLQLCLSVCGLLQPPGCLRMVGLL